MKNEIKWSCDICKEQFISETFEDYEIESRVIKIDIPTDDTDIYSQDNFEARNSCKKCRMKLSNAIYDIMRSEVLEIEPR
jgi:hypothetical protein